jgi:hypothetical protein
MFVCFHFYMFICLCLYVCIGLYDDLTSEPVTNFINSLTDAQKNILNWYIKFDYFNNDFQMHCIKQVCEMFRKQKLNIHGIITKCNSNTNEQINKSRFRSEFAIDHDLIQSINVSICVDLFIYRDLFLFLFFS